MGGIVQRSIRIFLFGNFEIFAGEKRLDGFACQRARELLAFLALQDGRTCHRTLLAAALWGHLDEARARKSLNTELWRLAVAMKAVGVDPEPRLIRSTQEVGFTCQQGDWIDLSVFSSGVEHIGEIDPESATDEKVLAVENAVNVYRGDLLETIYSDWCFVQREALRADQVAGLEFLMRARMARQDWTGALAAGTRLLGLDNLMENVHRAIMRCHYMAGNRPAAIRQYGICEKLLRDELGVEPMEETRRVYETMLAVTPRAEQAVTQEAARPAAISRDPTRTPAQKVDLALANINTATGWLEDASRELRERR